MTEFALAITSALWLGILTSISPCPLTTNIAAISFISRKSHKMLLVFSAGTFYAIGRILAYSTLSLLIVGSILSIPSVSFFFQKYMHIILGPLLILVGMFILEMISLPLPSFFKRGSMENIFRDKGIISATALGFIFALTFCPVSAALYFGSLIPLAVKNQSPITLSLTYGLGTALPVLIFSIALAGGSKAAAKLFNKVTHIEKWFRIGTGIVIIIIGLYFCLTYIFNLI